MCLDDRKHRKTMPGDMLNLFCNIIHIYTSIYTHVWARSIVIPLEHFESGEYFQQALSIDPWSRHANKSLEHVE